MENLYDLIILGGGPASMSASIYAKQMGLNTLLIEKSVFGGQVATTSTITNYLGFPVISGEELSEKMHEHAVSSGTDIAEEEITNTELSNTIKTVYTHNKKYSAKTVIIGIGTSVRTLGVDNEKHYINKGISYSTLKDREKYANKTVTVVGGGNSALEDAIYLSEKCSKVHLIHRRNEFRGDEILSRKVKTTPNIEIHTPYVPSKILGDNIFEGLLIKNVDTSKEEELLVSSTFVYIGNTPNIEFIKFDLEIKDGYILVDEDMKTSLDNVYAIGDVRSKKIRQIVTAVNDGAIAALAIEKEMKKA